MATVRKAAPSSARPRIEAGVSLVARRHVEEVRIGVQCGTLLDDLERAEEVGQRGSDGERRLMVHHERVVPERSLLGGDLHQRVVHLGLAGRFDEPDVGAEDAVDEQVSLPVPVAVMTKH